MAVERSRNRIERQFAPVNSTAQALPSTSYDARRAVASADPRLFCATISAANRARLVLPPPPTSDDIRRNRVQPQAQRAHQVHRRHPLGQRLGQIVDQIVGKALQPN